MDISQQIEAFLSGSTFAVVGASADRSKYGNKVLRCYQQAGKAVYPVHPVASRVEGLDAYPNLEALPQTVDAVSVVVPPAVTLRVLDDAARLGIMHLWLQPGAENEEVLRCASELPLNVIAGGPCILVALGYRD